MTFIVPVRGRISQPFGPSTNIAEPIMFGDRDAYGWKRCRPTDFTGSDGRMRFHPGTDIVVPPGTPILAPARGKVVNRVWYTTWCPLANNGAGGKVEGLLVEFRYFKNDLRQRLIRVDHCSRGVVPGTWLDGGVPFAWSGDTGCSTGPHVHEEDRVGPAGLHWSTSNTWMRLNPQRTFAF